MKVALVYDRANKIGGAERVLLALHEIYPTAPLYTAVYDPKGAPWAKVFDKIIPSFLQNFPLAKSHHEIYPWLMPLAFESFCFDEYDVVISVTSEAAKGIITKPKTLHICYCLTPTRYLWQSYWDYFALQENPAHGGDELKQEKHSPLEVSEGNAVRSGQRECYFTHLFWRAITLPLIVKLRLWDQIASARPDTYIAISKNVAQRIKKYYRREAEVIYPPMALAEVGSRARMRYKRFVPRSAAALPASAPHFLVVSRLVPYKRIDIAVEAFNKLGLPLKIIGSGVEEKKLKRMAKENVEFLGQNLTDQELVSYYQNCRAIIFPGEEDFGLVPIEAQACGRPVIAFRGGGVLESVIEGITGEFFSPQTSEALIKVVKKFDASRYQPLACRKNAERFSKEVFKENFKKFVEKVV